MKFKEFDLKEKEKSLRENGHELCLHFDSVRKSFGFDL